jgi:hypothetical protein
MRTEWFEDCLEEEIVGSSVLRPRWEIIRQALGAHKRREYLISIPTLLAQIEGAIGDALVLRNLAAKDGHKLYLLGTDGRPALDSKNKPIELKRLTGLVNNLDIFDYEALEEARSFIPITSYRGVTPSCTVATPPMVKLGSPSRRSLSS